MMIFPSLLAAKKKVLNSSVLFCLLLFASYKKVSAQIVINEIGIAPKDATPCSVFNPTGIDGGNGGEFLELFNPTTNPIDISCYVIMYSGGTLPSSPTGWTVTIPAGTAPIPAGGYFLVAGGGISASSNTTWQYCPLGGAPFYNTFGTNIACPILEINTTRNSNLNQLIPGNYSNSEAQVSLYNSSGSLIHSVSYNGGYNTNSYNNSFNNNISNGCSLLQPLPDNGISANTVSGSFGASNLKGIVRNSSGVFTASNNLTPGLPNTTTLGTICTAPVIGTISAISVCAGGTSSISVPFTGTAPTHYSIYWNAGSGVTDIPITPLSGSITSPVNIPISIPSGVSASINGTIILYSDCAGPTLTGATAAISCPKSFTVTPSALASIADQTPLPICSGTSFAGTPVSAPSGTTYTWTLAANANVSGQSAVTVSQSSIGQTLTNLTNINQTVVYTVTPKFSSCIGSTFKVTVTVNPKPIIPNQTTSTCNATTVSFGAINFPPSTIVPSGTTYSWTLPNPIVGGTLSNTSANTDTIMFLQTPYASSSFVRATYSLTPKAGNCTGSPFNLIVIINGKPIIGNQTLNICSKSSFSLTPSNGGGNIVPVGTTYTWSVSPNSNVSGQNDQPLAKTSIFDTLTNNSNTVQTIVYTVTPEVSTSPFCAGNPFTVTVNVYPQPDLKITNPTPVCSPAIVNIDLPAIRVTSDVYNPSPSASITSYSYFSDIAGTTTLANPTTINLSDTYYIRRVETINTTPTLSCSSLVKPVIVIIYPKPTLKILDSIPVCTASSKIDLTSALLIVGSTPYLTYSYYIDSPNVNLYPTPALADTGIYYIKGTSPAPQFCSTIKKLKIWLKAIPDTPVVTSPVYLCQYDQAVAPLNAAGTFPMRWFLLPVGGVSNALAPRPSTASAGNFTYYVAQMDTPCISPRATIYVTIYKKPNLGPDKDLKVCFGTAVNLDTVFNFTNLTTGWYLANGNPVDNPNAVTQAGTYEVYVADSANCQDDAKVNIVFLPKLTVKAAEDTTRVALLNTPHQLYGQGNGTEFSWTPANFLDFSTVRNPLATISSDTKFYLTVTNAAGCKGVDSILVKVLNVPGFYVPKAFTPNGDGLNDILKPIPVGITKLNFFKIFNRKGQIMFSTTSLNTGWDGTFKGQKQDIDTYVYIISGLYITGETRTTKGNVMLMR